MKLEAMKAFAKDNGIKVSKKETEKTLEKKIRENWEEEKIEMECLCPSCSAEIPDLNACPFCGSIFEEEDSTPKEEEKKEEKKPAKKDKAGKKKTKSKGKEKPAKKSKEKKGPKAGGLNFKDCVEHISSYVEKEGYEVRVRGNFTSYFIDGLRVFHISKATRAYSMEIGAPGFSMKMKHGEVKTFSDEERERKHMAGMFGILKTTDLDEALAAVKEMTKCARAYLAKNKKEKPAKKAKKKVQKKVTKKPAKKTAKKKAAKKPAKKVLKKKAKSKKKKK